MKQPPHPGAPHHAPLSPMTPPDATSPARPQPPAPNPARSSPTAAAAPSRPRRSPRRWVPWLAGAVLVAGLASALRPRPTPVETARVTRGALRASLQEEGRTRVRHRYQVSAPVSGLLRRIPFKAGAECISNVTILAVIDPIPPSLLDARALRLAEARRDAAEANLEKARTALGFATGDLNRFQRLFSDGTVSAQELESFQWRKAAAEKELAAAESARRQAEAELAEFGAATGSPPTSPAHPVQILAPASGKVLRVIEENARVVSAGTRLLEVGDPTDLEVVIDVLSREAAQLAPGTRVDLEHWGGPKPLEARVRLVEPAAFTKVSALGVEEQRVYVVADLVSPPAERPSLGDGYRVEARFVVWESEGVLKAPAGALFRRGPQWAAFVIQDGRAARRDVEAGRTSGLDVQILSGLNEGDALILYPGERITEGLRVQPIAIAP